jgi:hypothetical protein
MPKNKPKSEVGWKNDEGKQGWYPLPLVILKPLADVFVAGEKKYATFNCLQPFDDSDRRFWDATMRHLEECQLDPLSIDEETGCYHAAQVAFNTLLRLHNALRENNGR